ncbi:DUF6292 family protein [Actinokineospora bangkokensis]|uniref:DUF6292 domain-containing protein n=1 Tax=Actinokineospora bangkokensis TaxID=1193682 RepID=A0A1Q9LKY5_9PSEU|nr:DUF6292 family protein [Actinokineospora bangkokensis]OLR92663.1 hypothetical protein BJP25_21775 [Actinokineospora bangkokensis]
MTSPHGDRRPSHDDLAAGLRGYLQLVADLVGADHRAGITDVGSVASAVLPLPQRLTWFPERGLVLGWDEEHGWSAQLDAADGVELLPVSYLGVDALPTPRVVAWFLKDLLAGGDPGSPYPPAMRDRGEGDDFEERLIAYATHSDR